MKFISTLAAVAAVAILVVPSFAQTSPMQHDTMHEPMAHDTMHEPMAHDTMHEPMAHGKMTPSR